MAEFSGINVARTRYACVIIGGMLMGLSGAIFTLDYNPVWSYNFLMGWGFISLALVFFSMWNPLLLLAGSILFGTLWQLSLNPQLVLPGLLSRYIWRTVPFVITLGALILMSTKWWGGGPRLRGMVAAAWVCCSAPALQTSCRPSRPIAAAIRRRLPAFTMDSVPDFRQSIDASWPRSIDDSVAQRDWGWRPRYDLQAMVDDMLANLAPLVR